MTPPTVEMSKAIRETIERHALTLEELDDRLLSDFAEIVSAFAGDLTGELKRRRDEKCAHGYYLRQPPGFTALGCPHGCAA